MIRDRGLDEPRYVISIAARLVDLHPQTLRHYEDIGLVNPSRSEGNIRLYSQRDIERLHKITRLTDELGINLAGVEVILNMGERLEAMQSEVDALQGRLRAEMEAMRDRIRGEISELLKEYGDENDRSWEDIVKELEARLEEV